MAKLKDLLKENFSMVGGIVTQKPINADSSLTGIVEDLYGEKVIFSLDTFEIKINDFGIEFLY